MTGIADAFPLDPPTDWFTELPSWFEPNMKLTVLTDGPEAGRVAGSVAQRGTFILNGGVPWQSSDSPTRYRDAMQGDTYTADGQTVRTANLSAALNHVPEAATFGQAVDAMANTGAQLARVRYVDVPGYGTVALGAAWPGLSDLQVRKMQASALSGDWRWREEYGAYDMTGAIFVNSPGLPLPSRPVFAPLALAASVASPHPPILGNWVPEEFAMSMTGPTSMTVPGGGRGDVHIHVAAAGPPSGPGDSAPPPAPAPGPAVSPDVAPEDGSALEDRVTALEQRMDAVEAWITEDAMEDLDTMAAALPEAASASKYDADALKALADKGQVFNTDQLNYPIGDCEDVGNAVRAVGRGDADEAAIKGYIVGVAKKIDCVDSLPADWVKESTQVGT